MKCGTCGAERPAGGPCPCHDASSDQPRPRSEGDLPTLVRAQPAVVIQAQDLAAESNEAVASAATLTGGGQGAAPPSEGSTPQPDPDEALLFEGKFRTLRLIGRGGMGRVYLGQDEVLDRKVAIKVLATDLLGDDDAARRRFQHEAKTLAGLEHPNIVPIYSFGHEHGSPYFVMRYIEGTSLRSASGGGWSTADLVNRLEPICDGLEYIHRKGVVHRDIKPGNVVFTADRHPVLIDFGVALDPAQSRLTKGHGVVGTPTYMSPEQALGVAELGPASDQYSLAVIVYELLCGGPPFDGKTPMAVAFQHVNTPPVPPWIRCPEVPPRVGRVLLRALSKDPTERYGSCRQFWDSLRTAATGDTTAQAAQTAPLAREPETEGTTEGAETAPGRESGAGRPTRLGGWLAVVAAVLAALGLGAALLQRFGSGAPTPAPQRAHQTPESLAAGSADTGSKQPPRDAGRPEHAREGGAPGQEDGQAEPPPTSTDTGPADRVSPQDPRDQPGRPAATRRRPSPRRASGPSEAAPGRGSTRPAPAAAPGPAADHPSRPTAPEPAEPPAAPEIDDYADAKPI